MKKLVLTGAAGRLGSYLREPLSKLADELVTTDIVDNVGKLYPGERYVAADLHNYDAMAPLIEGADMVVHFGANGDEAPFDNILRNNIVGAYNVWEAAYQHGVRRVVYASSIHAVGMYPSTDFIDTEVAHRPDTFYGLSKCFAEDLARMYWDKRGIEAVCLRILSCAQVTSVRALGTWLSYDDMIELVLCSINAAVTEFSVVYGVSDNDRAPVDNSRVGHLGFRPKDNAEQFAAEILADTPPVDHNDLAQTRVGGPFATVPLGSSGQAMMNIIDDSKKG
ncbi:MAG: NAD(P)-dependent oxidoreductase [Pseudomonadota bacterium]